MIWQYTIVSTVCVESEKNKQIKNIKTFHSSFTQILGSNLTLTSKKYSELTFN